MGCSVSTGSQISPGGFKDSGQIYPFEKVIDSKKPIMPISQLKKKSPEIKTSDFPGPGKLISTDLFPPNENYYLTRIRLFSTIDLKWNSNFAGIELEWKSFEKEEEKSFIASMIAPDSKPDCEIHLTKFDYIHQISWYELHANVGHIHIHYLAFHPHMARKIEVGSLLDKADISTVSGGHGNVLHGFKLSRNVYVHRLSGGEDCGLFVRLEPQWKKLNPQQIPPNNEIITNNPIQATYLTDLNTFNSEIYSKQKVYNSLSINQKFIEFTNYIDTNNRSEYLGCLPRRFLAPEEKKRLNNMIESLQALQIQKVLQQESDFRNNNADASLQDEILRFSLILVTTELFNPEYKLYDNEIFARKVFTIICNNNQDIWKQLVTKFNPIFQEFKKKISTNLVANILNSSKKAELQAIPTTSQECTQAIATQGFPEENDYTETLDVSGPSLYSAYIFAAYQIRPRFIYELHHEKLTKGKNWKILVAPVKEKERVFTKCEEYISEKKLTVFDAFAKILDFVRATFICQSVEEIMEVYSIMKELWSNRPEIKIVRIKNGFVDLQTEGFKALYLNLLIDEAQVCEIQITLADIEDFNKFTHFCYEVIRETSCTNLVNKYLHVTKCFQDWIQPFVPVESQVLFLESDAISFSGYINAQFQQINLNLLVHLKLVFKNNGTIAGTYNFGTQVSGTYRGSQIKISIHENSKPMILEGTLVQQTLFFGTMAPLDHDNIAKIGLQNNRLELNSDSFVENQSHLFRLVVTSGVVNPQALPSKEGDVDENGDYQILRNKYHTENAKVWYGFRLDREMKEAVLQKFQMILKPDGTISHNFEIYNQEEEKYQKEELTGKGLHDKFQSITLWTKDETNKALFVGDFVENGDVVGTYFHDENLDPHAPQQQLPYFNRFSLIPSNDAEDLYDSDY